MTPISSKIHSTFGVKITLKRELKYRSKKYSQIGVNWGLFFTPLLESNLLLENNSVGREECIQCIKSVGQVG